MKMSGRPIPQRRVCAKMHDAPTTVNDGLGSRGQSHLCRPAPQRVDIPGESASLCVLRVDGPSPVIRRGGPMKTPRRPRRRSFVLGDCPNFRAAKMGLSPSGRSAQRKRDCPPPESRSRRLRVEPLEDRRLLSGGGQDQGGELVRPRAALGDGPPPDPPPPLEDRGTGVPPYDFDPFDPMDWQQGAMGGLPALADPIDEPEVVVTRSTQFSVTFDGANLVEPVGLNQAETYFNYFIGAEENWHAEVPRYEIVAYPGLYDGIDLMTWGLRSHLKYEFHVD